jgi:diaminopimelate epimerase
MHFHKYHALGNDYLIVDPNQNEQAPSCHQIQLMCHRNFGIGSDGILFGPHASASGDFALQIFNPDGSEAEKSGNGLRIFSRYLWDQGRVDSAPFTIDTAGGLVTSQVLPEKGLVAVEMGKVSFDSRRIPVTGPAREVIDESIQAGDRTYRFCAATIGNPHCVIIQDELSVEETKTYGPLLENESRFSNRTNVQFMKILDRRNIQLKIWERGAGYTLASGSSSCAAAAVAVRLGLCDDDISVHMPGGNLRIKIDKDFAVSMQGPVVLIGQGAVTAELFDQALP